jgi:ATP-binding cassette subfamily B protein
MLFFMLYLTYRHTITMGQFWSLYIYLFMAILGPASELGNIASTFREAEASLESYHAILKSAKEVKPRRPLPLRDLTVVHFEHVSFQHPSARTPTVTDVTFTARAGDTIAFVGPSGAGKTTLVRLLLGLYRPASGRVLYEGIPGDAIDFDQLRERVGLVTQDTQLFSGSIRDNLLFVNPKASDEECLRVLRRAACDSLLARSARGLDTVIGEGGVKVSGGERQRLAIARALLRRPQLLVFDEATSALDSLTEEAIVQTMREVAMSSRVITMLIAHRLSTVMHADQIHVLEHGRIVETGCHAQLVDRKGLYYAMWRQQVGERDRPGSLPEPRRDAKDLPDEEVSPCTA